MAIGFDWRMKVVILTVLLITVIPQLTLAHGPEGEPKTHEGYTFELTPQQVIEGDAVPIEVSITKNDTPVTGLQVFFVVDKHESGISDRIDATEREPGKYFAKYKFAESGPYEVHVEFTAEGRELRETFDIDVVSSGVKPEFFLMLGAVGILLVVVSYAALSKKKPSKKNVAILAAVLLGALFLGYSLYVTFQSGAASRGVVVCTENECFWTQHVHAYVPITVCGEDVRLPIEKGDLDWPHTHEEKNVIHVHTRIPYDMRTQTIKDTTKIELGTFFDQMGIYFNEDGVLDKRNGDACPDGTGTLKMFVNGEHNDEFREYVWRDRDVIVLVFDNRTEEDVEAELKANPMRFPELGRG